MIDGAATLVNPPELSFWRKNKNKKNKNKQKKKNRPTVRAKKQTNKQMKNDVRDVYDL